MIGILMVALIPGVRLDEGGEIRIGQYLLDHSSHFIRHHGEFLFKILEGLGRVKGYGGATTISLRGCLAGS